MTDPVTADDAQEAATAAQAAKEAGAQALQDAAREARVVELHGPADRYDWANWLEFRAMEVRAGTIPIGD